MTEQELNNTAYYYASKIKILESIKNSDRKSGSMDHLHITDISGRMIDSPIVERSLNPEFSNYKLVIKTNKAIYGFDNSEYLDFYCFTKEISDFEDFNKLVSNDFIDETSMKWMIDIFITGKSNCDLISHLRNTLDEVVQEELFYFPVINLHIPRPFKVGNIEFTFFTKDFFDSYWQRLKDNPEYTEEIFDKLFRKYQGRVFTCALVNAERKKAKEIAFKNCALAIDIIKMFTPTVYYPTKSCYIDLEEKTNFNFQSDFISQKSNDKYSLRFTMSAKNDPFIIDEQGLDLMFKRGLDLFSRFISEEKKSELSCLLKQSFGLYSIAISNFDLHFRIAQLITISESLLLENDRKHKLEKSCKDRFCFILSPKDKEMRLIINNNLTEMYQIRHKIMHKAIRLYINTKLLSSFQLSIIGLFRNLVLYEKNINNKEELISFIDGKINGSA